MASYHCLDPEGDVTLNLHQAQTSFAIWNDCEPSHFRASKITVNLESADVDQATSKKTKKIKKGRLSTRSAQPETMVVPESMNITHNAEESSVKLVSSTVAALYETEMGMKIGPLITSESTPDAQFRVSSRHLVLASKHFQKALCEHWREGSILRNKGLVCIELHGWDSTALLIVLNIIHSRTRAVPRSIDLDMFAKIAVLTDYYQCHEAIEVFADMWMSGLAHRVPTKYGRDLVLWMSVCDVFDRPKELEHAVRIVVKQARGPLQTLELPFSHGFVDRIDRAREEAIKRTLDVLQCLRTESLLTGQNCSFECDSILLGALTKEMHLHGLHGPQPKGPFIGLDLDELWRVLQQFREPDWRCTRRQHEFGIQRNQQHCTLQFHINTGISSIEAYLSETWRGGTIGR